MLCVLRVQGWNSLSRMQDTFWAIMGGFKISSGFGVPGSGFRVLGRGLRVQASGFRTSGSGFRGYVTCAG